MDMAEIRKALREAKEAERLAVQAALSASRAVLRLEDLAGLQADQPAVQNVTKTELEEGIMAIRVAAPKIRS